MSDVTPIRSPLRVAALIPAYQAAAHLGEVLLRLAALDPAPEVLDADGQHPPETFPDFVRAAETGADVVLGRRRFDVGMPWVRRFANTVSSGWATLAAGQRISDSQCGYRLYRREVLAAVPVRASRYEVESEMAVRAARLGFRVTEIDVPTIYGSETSHIRLHQDVPRILGTLARLSLEALSPPPEMQAARRTLAARRPGAETTS
jgi:hypothetical protein